MNNIFYYIGDLIACYLHKIFGSQTPKKWEVEEWGI